MKKIIISAGTILFCLGFAVATGIEANPSQALIAIPMLVVGALCLCSVEESRFARSEK